MKALTLWQPWASLVAVGAKTIETRSWSTDYRGPLAIHAAARPPLPYPAGASQALEGAAPDELPRGAIIAICTLVNVGQIPDNGRLRYGLAEEDGTRTMWDVDREREFGDYTPGRYLWLLGDISPLCTPVPARGRQGLWEWTP